MTATEPRLHIVLVAPEIAANTGAIGRTCVAVGAMLWLVRPLGFHIDDRHRRRAGLDYWDSLNWRVVDQLDEVVAALGRDRPWSFSTRGSAPIRPWRISPATPSSSARKATVFLPPGSRRTRTACSASRSGPKPGA